MDSDIMEEIVQSADEVEDGEISDSSSDIYQPLERPAALLATLKPKSLNQETENSPLATCHQLKHALDDNDVSQNSDSISSESSDDSSCLKSNDTAGVNKQSKKRNRRTIMVRVEPTTEEQQKRARFKKYEIWSAELQAEALTENMQGCGVTTTQGDRSVENYDFTLKHRLSGERNTFKRRHSNSTDDLSDTGGGSSRSKRGRRNRSSSKERNSSSSSRPSVKSRIGYHHKSRPRRDLSSASTTGSDNSSEPRHILDLNSLTGRDEVDIATEIATKLYEENEELMLRVVNVLGLDLPIRIFKETQRIEADGGMIINNGHRRRTPGGVFLFLLKNDDNLTTEQKKAIFAVETRNANRHYKKLKSLSRDRKVEELKKRLGAQKKDLPNLHNRSEHYLLGGAESKKDTGNLSNPPPSPEPINCQSPDYKTHAINPPDLSTTTTTATTSTFGLTNFNSDISKSTAVAAAVETDTFVPLTTYDDDFLDLNSGAMDFF